MRGAEAPRLILNYSTDSELLDDADQVRYLGDHATDGWGVFALDDLVEASEAEALYDKLVLDRGADLGTEVLQLDCGRCVLGCHWTRTPLKSFERRATALRLPCRAGRRLRPCYEAG